MTTSDDNQTKKPEVAAGLIALANEPLLAHQSGQLRRLAADLEDRDRAAAWSELNLNQVFVPDEQVLAEEPFSKRIRNAEIARGVLIFLPLLITWLGIALATRAYSAALEKSPELAGQPFVALWERGFDGAGSFSLPLSTVALLDVIAIAALIAVAVYLQNERARTEIRQIGDLQRVRNQLASTLLDASLLLVPAKLASPQRFQVELNESARSMHRLLDQIRGSAESNALASTAAAEATTRLVNSADALTEASTRVEAASDGIASSLGDIRQPVEDLGEAMSELQASTRDQQVALSSVARELIATLGQLQSTAEEADSRAASLSGQLDASVRTHQQYAAELGRGLTDQQALTAALGAATSSLADVHHQIAAGSQAAASSAQQATAASQQFVELVNRSTEAIGALVESQKALSELLRVSNASVEVGVSRLRTDLEQLHVVLNWLSDLGRTG